MSQERHAALGIHHIDDTDPQQLVRRKRVMRRTRMLVVLVLIGLAVGAGRTVMSRSENAKVLEAAVVENAKLYVRTASPKAGSTAQNLLLPGTLQGFVQSPIAARASGYLKKWHADIGTRVKEGQLLAEIETPEIDQQLSQAIAARDQVASSLALAKSTRERWEALRQRDVVSQQDLEERRSSEAQGMANLKAAEANVERLRQLEAFKRIVAPFSGVITRRNVDVGDLIDAGGGAARALFLLAQTDPLRVYVSVPQSYAHLVKSGHKVTITQTELRGRSFTGSVVRTAGAIDAASRTMQIEVVLSNKDGALMPGAYVQVQLPIDLSQAMTIPSNALIVRSDGLQVALVDANGRVAIRNIKIGRNFGQSMEVLAGVELTDKLVLNPPDSLVDGDKVEIAPTTTVERGAAAKKGKS